MILFFDTETSGFMKKDLPLGDPSQPWCVSVAAKLCEDDGAETDQFFSFRIRSEGRMMSPGSVAVHGITPQIAEVTGIQEAIAMMALSGFIKQAHTIVGHNIKFDRQIVTSVMVGATEKINGWLYHAAKMEDSSPKAFAEQHLRLVRDELKSGVALMDRPNRRWECTMLASVGICKLEHKGKFADGHYKWPTLDEASEIILGEPRRDGHHAAFDDLERCKRIFFELKRRNVFEEKHDG